MDLFVLVFASSKLDLLMSVVDYRKAVYRILQTLAIRDHAGADKCSVAPVLPQKQVRMHVGYVGEDDPV